MKNPFEMSYFKGVLFFALLKGIVYKVPLTWIPQKMDQEQYRE